MSTSQWQINRTHFAAAFGLLLALANQFPHPKAIFAYAIAGAITALRFHTLGWRWQKAFTPFAIAVVGIALGALAGSSSAAGIAIARMWRAAALFTQGGMILRAAIASAAIDPASPKQRLARDFLSKRRQSREAISEFRPAIDSHRKAMEKLNDLRAELAADISAHGAVQTELRSRLMQRITEQTALVKASTEQLRAETQRLNAKTSALRDAAQAWNDRDKAA